MNHRIAIPCIAIIVMLMLLTENAYSLQPNIVFILADDLGYNDVGYHNSQIRSPTIDFLASEGVQLESYYTQPICTPTRSTLMTGRYPIHVGFQNVGSINVQQSYGLPLNFTILPQELKKLGYATHIIGKWHLGYYKSQYLPTNRGFDTHFGYYGADLNYFTHTSYDVRPQPPPNWCLDLHNGSECVSQYNGTYSLDLYMEEAERIINHHNASKPLFLYLPMQNVHNPNQVPKYYQDMYSHIVTIDRQIICGMVTALDDGIARMVSVLKSKGETFWNNTIIIFAADNGGWTIPQSAGSNYPLRGGKFTLWEGGLRVASFVYGALLKNPRRIEKNLVHVSDWYPTLVGLAGGKINAELDGVDQWQLISEGSTDSYDAPRKLILHNIIPNDQNSFNTSAIRIGNWKLMTGSWANCTIYSNPYYCSWMPSGDKMYEDLNQKSNAFYHNGEKSTLKATRYDPIMLFNIEQDPREMNDLKEQYPDIVDIMLDQLDTYWNTILPPVNQSWGVVDDWQTAAITKGCLTPWADVVDLQRQLQI